MKILLFIALKVLEISAIVFVSCGIGAGLSKIIIFPESLMPILVPIGLISMVVLTIILIRIVCLVWKEFIEANWKLVNRILK